jgi:hypothetical protein
MNFLSSERFPHRRVPSGTNCQFYEHLSRGLPMSLVMTQPAFQADALHQQLVGIPPINAAAAG